MITFFPGIQDSKTVLNTKIDKIFKKGLVKSTYMNMDCKQLKKVTEKNLMILV